MKKLTTIVMTIALILTMAAPAYAGEYLTGKFKFGSYAPVIRFEHCYLTGYDLTVQSNGTLRSTKHNEDNWAQLFTVIPSERAGYYVIREFNNGGYSQRVLTCTGSGYKMTYPKTDKWGTAQYTSKQMFRFKFYASRKWTSKTVKNVYLLITPDGDIFCAGGSASWKLYQENK